MSDHPLHINNDANDLEIKKLLEIQEIDSETQKLKKMRLNAIRAIKENRANPHDIPKCEYCGKYLGDRRKRMVKHTNIAQEPGVHLFHTLKCKTKWIYKKQREMN